MRTSHSGRIRRLLTLYLLKAQSFHLYGSIARLARTGIVIEEADRADMPDVKNWMYRHREMTLRLGACATNFVAKKNGKVIGFARLVKDPVDFNCAEYWLFNLQVRIRYRRMGIGKDLTMAAIEKVKKVGGRELFLIVNKSSGSAVRLYRNIGFKVKQIPSLEKTLVEGLKSGVEFVVMGKSLL